MRITLRICRLMSRLNGASIRELKFLVGAGEESVGDQGGLGRPPTVDSCLANIGVGGDGFNAEFRESTILLQQLQRAAQDRPDATPHCAAARAGACRSCHRFRYERRCFELRRFWPALAGYDFEPWRKSNII